MNSLIKEYESLVSTTLLKKESIFGYSLSHDMRTGFPLINTCNLNFNEVKTELLWFLRGDTKIKFLLDHKWLRLIDEIYDYYKNINIRKKDFVSKEIFIQKIKSNDKDFVDYNNFGFTVTQWRSLNRWNVKYNDELTHIKKGYDQINGLITSLLEGAKSHTVTFKDIVPHRSKLNFSHYSFLVRTKDLTLHERLRLVPYDISEKINSHNTLDILDYLDKIGIPKKSISLLYNSDNSNLLTDYTFNLAFYGLLLEFLGKILNMVPINLVSNVGYIFVNKEEFLENKYELQNISHILPNLIINTEFWPTTNNELGSNLIDSLSIINSLIFDDHFCNCFLNDDVQLI